MIEFTEWARDILERAERAAQRFNSDARIRLSRVGSTIQASLTDEPEADDQPVEVGSMTLFVERGLEGLIDVEEPHDRLVLRPIGFPPNVRGEH